MRTLLLAHVAARLFRHHVRWRAELVTRLCPVQGGILDAGQPEVAHLDFKVRVRDLHNIRQLARQPVRQDRGCNLLTCRRAAGEQEVARCDVAVQHLLLVGILDGEGRLTHQAGGITRLKRSTAQPIPAAFRPSSSSMVKYGCPSAEPK